MLSQSPIGCFLFYFLFWIYMFRYASFSSSLMDILDISLDFMIISNILHAIHM